MGRMDWNRQDRESHRDALRNIVALLLSFASIADRLPALPDAIHAFLLGLLLQARGAGRSFVIAEVNNHGAPAKVQACLIPALILAGDDSHDAAHMALTFRALALTVAAMLESLADACPSQPRTASRQPEPRLIPPCGNRSWSERSAPGPYATAPPDRPRPRLP